MVKTHGVYINGAWQNYRSDIYTRDLHGQITQLQSRDLVSNRLRTLLTQQWNGRQLMSRTDDRGITTTYSYFPETNIVQQTRREALPGSVAYAAQPAITTVFSGSFTVNAAQVPVWKQKITTTTAGSFTQVVTDTYDEKNRIISHTDANALTTTTAYSSDDLVTTDTFPSGSTRITAKDSQGRVLCVTGTAVVAKFYAYEILPNGNERVTTYFGQDNGPRYQIEEKDSSGRIVRTASPASGGGVRENLATYGNLAHPQSLTQVTRTAQATSLHEFNAVGSSILDGLSADDAALQPTSATDRISTTVTTDEFVANAHWRVSRTSILPTSGSAVPQLVSTTRLKLSGLSNNDVSVTESIDIVGNVTTKTSAITGAVESERVARTGFSGLDQKTYYGGRLTYYSPAGFYVPHIYTYDALGRRISERNPRHTQAATTAYNAGNQVISTTDAAGSITTYVYHPQGTPGAGKLKTLMLPDGSRQHYLYTARGELKASWGSQLNPTWNEFDSYGQFITLRTWQVAPTLDIAAPPATPPPGFALTTWNYDPATGLLISKRDAANAGADYLYDPAGRLAKRTWARSVAGVRLATLYTTNPFGETTTVDYADTTPDVAMQRDRIGRVTSVTQTNQSKLTYSYNPTTLALASELIQYDLDSNGTYEFTRTLDRTRDALLRESGYSLKTDYFAQETASATTYSPTDGRVSQISNPQISNQLFSYSYTPNSDLLAAVSGPVHTVTNTWEPNRDVLDIKQNKVGSTLISGYDYAVNAIGQRTGVTTSGTAFPATPSWAWSYDPLGQVIAADSNVNTSDRSYQYDAIGNRQKSADSLTLPVANNYVATATNSYSSVQQFGGTTSFTYDLDGNMTQGSSSILQSDAENRLVAMRAGNPIFEYKYDAQGRRISQRCITFPTVAKIYIYDAWNCIAEYDKTQTATLAKTRLWGTDLSGTPQGAGGVGGLLSETQISNPQSPIHYPTYDGNGNISEYLTTTGTIAAHFEYDPFGNTLVNTDTINKFTYRFSTKPLTEYTGLYYYGYRYYDPRNGRWMGRDPMGEKGGINLCGFLANNTLANYDFLGLHKQDKWWGHNDKDFQKYAHKRKNDEPGRPDFTRDEIEELQEDYDKEKEDKKKKDKKKKDDEECPEEDVDDKNKIPEPIPVPVPPVPEQRKPPIEIDPPPPLTPGQVAGIGAVAALALLLNAVTGGLFN